LHDGEKIGVVVPALVQRFGHAMAKAAQLRALELGDLVDALLPEDREMTADLRATALDSLVEAPDARSLLDALVAAITQDDVPQNPDFVRVMSLHKSKGLTSAAVSSSGALMALCPRSARTNPMLSLRPSRKAGVFFTSR
jgi:hypothetical protein